MEGKTVRYKTAYVSIKEQLTRLAGNPDFLASLVRQGGVPGRIASFADGPFCKKAEAEAGDQRTLWLTMFYDDFSPVQALSAAGTTQKMFAIYWQPTELAPELASKRENVRLMLLAPKRALKYAVTLHQLMEPLIEEMNEVLTNGIILGEGGPNQEHVRVRVAGWCGDNEAVRFLFGHKPSFHKGLHLCHLCHVTADDIQDIRNNESENLREWTREEYDEQVGKIWVLFTFYTIFLFW